ncbi:MAG: UDP-N-acetylmuramoyl-L-alanyl-D-glutamate--2,6-diaminopimelate ligase [Clostridia bacterium]
MILQYLLEDLKIEEVIGKTDIKINKIEYDSKKIVKDDIFIAITGFEYNGKDYILEAIKNGATVIITDTKYIDDNITVVIVHDTRIAMSEIASKFYGNPKDKLKLIGITGTKGKTTTAYMIRDIMLNAGKKIGMIGTIYTTYNDVIIDSTRTSPESLDLHKLLKDMVDNDIEYVVMEVSSHALELNRVYGLHFVTCVFTNLSEEHLDFHETMDNYLIAKSKLFKITDFALINGDDKYSNELIKLIDCKIAKFGLDNEVNITASDVRINASYTEFKMYINKMLETITIKIPGRYTVYNAIAAIGVCSMFNIQMDSIITALSNLKVPGRSEVVDINKTFTVIVDYAHNPSSMEAILASTKRYAKGRIITVFGCGGNRDKSKRSVMGEISGKYSNFTVITTDNPRKENYKNICREIEVGIKNTSGLYKIIENRHDAIAFAMRIAWKNDIVLVLGKGHETYQILGDKTINFDDREVVKQIASEMNDKNIEEEVN